MRNIFVMTLFLFQSWNIMQGQETGEVVIPLSNPSETGLLEIDLRTGTIEVVGKDRSDVLVRYTLKEKDDNCVGCEKAEKQGLKRLKNNSLDMEMSENENHVKIESKSWENGPDIYVEIPKEFNAHLDTYNGHEISVSNVSGELSLEGYIGDIIARNISGFVSASSYSGSINIQMDDLNMDKPMAFSTYSGDIDLTFPTSFQSDLKIKTKWGDVFSSYDLVMDESKPQLKKEEGSSNFKLVSETWVYGKINGGGPETMIKSTSGNIYLREN